MSRRVAILQSNYIPWKGTFDLIHQVDEFILFDDMQFTVRDWRNRNRIKTPKGAEWLTIPVETADGGRQRIADVRTSGDHWRRTHWKTILQNYARAPYFREHAPRFEALYLGEGERCLSRINHRFLAAICEVLDIRTRITWSMDYSLEDGRTERLVDLCRQAGADEYLSGPAARAYIDPGCFEAAGIQLCYIEYGGYPEYHQLFPPFVHEVTVLDLIFNEGPDATRYMKSF